MTAKVNALDCLGKLRPTTSLTFFFEPRLVKAATLTLTKDRGYWTEDDDEKRVSFRASSMLTKDDLEARGGLADTASSNNIRFFCRKSNDIHTAAQSHDPAGWFAFPFGSAIFFSLLKLL